MISNPGRARLQVVASALAAFGLAACNDGGNAPAAVPPTAPQPIAATSSLAVSFPDSALSVAEGETAEIAVRYQALELEAPVNLRVSVLPGTAEAEDYEVSPDMLEIPAGTNPDGEGSLTLRALTDRLFAEGEETLEVRLVPPAGMRAELASGLAVTIEEAGANPCAGTVVEGQPPWIEEGFDVARTRLALDFAPGSGNVVFDWFAPYDGQAEEVDFVRKEVGRTSRFQAAILAWTTERMVGVIRHTIEFAWPAGTSGGAEAGVRFRSDDGACAGEPMAVCTGFGCELIP